MALPEGAHYVPGTNRKHVRLADGTIVTRAIAENMSIAARGIPGITNRYQMRRLRLFGQTDRGQDILTSERHRRNARLAERLRNRNDPRAVDPETFDDLALALKMDTDRRGGRLDKSPDSVIAHYLIAIGQRDPGADYSVGETPDVR